MEGALEQGTRLIHGAYCIPGPTNVGAIVGNSGRSAGAAADIYLVDSGMNSADAERICGALHALFPPEAGGFRVKAVVNTHSHADHAGGNAWFQRTSGCEIWTARGETGSLLNPQVQAAVAWGGNPVAELKTPYLAAEPCTPTRIIAEGAPEHLSDGGRLDFIPLPGHYFDMTGVRYTNSRGEAALFVGDAVFGRAHILKYWIPFLYDVGAFKATLRKLCRTAADVYIPSHGVPVPRIDETAELNEIAVRSTEASILKALDGAPLTHEEILKRVADQNGIRLKTAQYVLIGCTLRAYLVHLAEAGRITYGMRENRLLWHLADEPPRR